MVEPVSGIITDVLGFRQFSVRGLSAATGEWGLVCLAFNRKRLQTRLLGDARLLGGPGNPWAGADPAVGPRSALRRLHGPVAPVAGRDPPAPPRVYGSAWRAGSSWPSPCVFSPTDC